MRHHRTLSRFITGFSFFAFAALQLRVASACSPPYCAVAIEQTPIANFAANAVRIPVDTRALAALTDSPYIENQAGDRVEVVLKSGSDGQRWLEPVGSLGLTTWNTLHYDGQCVPFDADETTTSRPSEFTFFVGMPEPEPTTLFKDISIAEVTTERPGTKNEAFRIVLSLDLAANAIPHIGRIKPSLRVDDHGADVVRVEQVPLRVDCDVTGQASQIDSCGGLWSVGQGIHKLVLNTTLVGGASPMPVERELLIDCAGLRRGEAPAIGAVGTLRMPGPANTGAPGPGGTAVTADGGGCSVMTGNPSGGAATPWLGLCAWLFVLRMRIRDRRVPSVKAACRISCPQSPARSCPDLARTGRRNVQAD